MVPEEIIPKSVPAELEANVCTDPVSPFSEVIAALNLLLKVDQSDEDNKPLFEAEEVGILNVTVPDVVAILKSDPEVPVTNVNVGPLAPFIVVVAPDPPPVEAIVMVSFAPALFFVSVTPDPATNLLNKYPGVVSPEETFRRYV